MVEICVRGLKTKNIINWGENVFDHFYEAILENQEMRIKDNDIIIITSKIVSMEQNAYKIINNVVPSEIAINLGKKYNMDPKVVEVISEACNGEILGGVEHALLTKSKFGLSANAGVDLSNCPKGYILLLPNNPDKFADSFRKQINKKFNVDVAVLIIDSRTLPLKRGTSGVCLGLSGISPIVDERGNQDLYGKELIITTKAVADNLATMGNLVMGEADEQMPFAIISGFNYKLTRYNEEAMKETMMPENECLYFAPLMGGKLDE